MNAPLFGWRKYLRLGWHKAVFCPLYSGKAARCAIRFPEIQAKVPGKPPRSLLMTSGSSHVFGKLPEVIPPKAFAVEGKRLPLEELYNYTVRAQYGRHINRIPNKKTWKNHRRGRIFPCFSLISEITGRAGGGTTKKALASSIEESQLLTRNPARQYRLESETYAPIYGRRSNRCRRRNVQCILGAGR